MTLNARFPVASDSVQMSTATAVDDTVQNGILLDVLGAVARVALAGGTQFQNGLLLTPTSQVVIYDTDAGGGMPADVHWQNGLPLTMAGELCVSTDPVQTWQNGLPFATSGAVSVTVTP
jgi:hypothetical protein